MISPIRTRTVSRLATLAFAVSFAALFSNPSPGFATTSAPSLGSASGFAALAGTAVTCTNSSLTGNVGVWPGTAITQTGCTLAGALHAGDDVAEQAFLDFLSAYHNLVPLNNACNSSHTLTGTLNGQYLSPGVYCVDAVAKAGTLTLDAHSDPNAFWIFLVNGALTGTGFNVGMLNGGQPCNVYWWVKDAGTLTTSNFLGTILAGGTRGAITVTNGTISGNLLAATAVTLTSTRVTACQATAGNGHGTGNHGGDGDDDGDDHGHGDGKHGDDHGHDDGKHGDDHDDSKNHKK